MAQHSMAAAQHEVSARQEGLPEPCELLEGVQIRVVVTAVSCGLTACVTATSILGAAPAKGVALLGLSIGGGGGGGGGGSSGGGGAIAKAFVLVAGGVAKAEGKGAGVAGVSCCGCTAATPLAPVLSKASGSELERSCGPIFLLGGGAWGCSSGGGATADGPGCNTEASIAHDGGDDRAGGDPKPLAVRTLREGPFALGLPPGGGGGGGGGGAFEGGPPVLPALGSGVIASNWLSPKSVCKQQDLNCSTDRLQVLLLS